MPFLKMTAVIALLATPVLSACPGACASAKMFDAAMADMATYALKGFTCKPDVDFMAGMIGHHAGAIAMCHVLYALTAPGKKPTDPLIGGASDKMPFFAAPGSMCYNVTTSQTSEVKAMYAYLAKNGHPTPDKFEGGLDCESSKAYLDANAGMMFGMSLDYTCDPTADFVSGMIAHHKGAIAMCKVVTDAQASGTKIDPEVATMCKGVVAAQSSEIGFMTKWLTGKGYPGDPVKCASAPSPPPPPSPPLPLCNCACGGSGQIGRGCTAGKCEGCAPTCNAACGSPNQCGLSCSPCEGCL